MEPAETQVSNRRGKSAWATQEEEDERECERERGRDSEEIILMMPAVSSSKAQAGVVHSQPAGAANTDDAGGERLRLRGPSEAIAAWLLNDTHSKIRSFFFPFL